MERVRDYDKDLNFPPNLLPGKVEDYGRNYFLNRDCFIQAGRVLGKRN